VSKTFRPYVPEQSLLLPPNMRDWLPEDQRSSENFTDPDSRITVDGATKAFVQAYNAQNAVSEDRIIVAVHVDNVAPDQQKLVPMVHAVQRNLGELPARVSADAGYHSDAALSDASVAAVDLYVPAKRERHGAAPIPCVPLPADASRATRCAPSSPRREGARSTRVAR